MKKNILTSAITLAICGITTLAIAEESTTLPPITVTADYNTGVADMVTVTDKAIEDTAVTSPRNLVRNIPGVELENRATEGFRCELVWHLFQPMTLKQLKLYEGRKPV